MNDQRQSPYLMHDLPIPAKRSYSSPQLARFLLGFSKPTIVCSIERVLFGGDNLESRESRSLDQLAAAR